MSANAQPTAFSRCRHSGNLHCMVELINAGCYLFDKKRRPASVSRTPRVLRSNRVMPRSSPSTFIRALTLDWLVPSARAARWKLKHSATARVCTKAAMGIRPRRSGDEPDFRFSS